MNAPSTAAPTTATSTSNHPLAGRRNEPGVGLWLTNALDEQIIFDAAILMGSSNELREVTRNSKIQLDRLRFRVPPAQTESIAKQMISACKKAAEHREFKSRRLLRPERAISAIPISYEDGGVRVLGLLTRRPIDGQTQLPEIRSILHEYYSRELTEKVGGYHRSLLQAAAGIELITKANQADSLSSACQVLCSELARHLGLDRVAIGCFDETQSTCELRAMSDTVKIDRHHQAVRDVELAMLHTGRELPANVVFSPSEQPIELGRLSEQWKTPVLAMPLGMDNQDAVASVLLGGTRANIQKAEQFLTAHRGPLASVLIAQRTRRWDAGIRNAWNRVFSRPGIAAAIGLICLVVSFFIPIGHYETFNGSIEPSLRRFVAAPADGILELSTVSPGDLVESGQTLASLDRQELQWKRDAIVADVQRLSKKRDAARASSQFADQRIAELEIQQLDLELEVLDRQMSRFELLSPIDGVVVSGELDRMKGVPVERGQALFEIAPLDQMVVEVAIPDTEIEYVASGQLATVTVDANAGATLQTSIEKIHPRSEIRDNENVFIAHCKLANESESLRPGMKGQVKVYCGRRSLAWVLFHRPYDSILRMVYP
ncbi:MAG: efflux RND transporter periplasmic adaptor subunit [Planctomycetota bacterium]